MFFVILLALLSALPLCAQSSPPPDQPGQANDTFSAQRSYPNGIPDDAIGKAMQQRRALESLVQAASSRQAASEAIVYQWAPLGPAVVNSPEGTASGRVTCIAVDPRNPEFVYAGAAGGGIWLSKDAGKTWQSLGDNMTSLVSGALALDRGTGMLYYGTGDYGARTYGAGIFRSPDSGTTWMDSNGWDASRNKPQFTGGTTSRIVIDPSDSRIVYAARNSGLWRSTDSGDSWYRLIVGDASDFVLDPGNPARLFVALGRSTGSIENGVYRSEDRGETWTRMNALPSALQPGRISLAMAASNSAVVYALFSEASDQQALGLFRTSDSGKSWIGLPVPYGLFDSDGRGHGYFDNFVAVDPGDSNVVFLGGVELYKSTNGGLNWSLISRVGDTRIIHEDQFSIAFKPGDPHTIYLGNDGGIYKSSDSGQTWQSLNQGLPVTQFNSIAVHPQNSQLVFGGTQDQGLVRFSGNTAWDQMLRGDAGVVLFSPPDPKRMFAAKQRIKPLRSNDGGATWEIISAGISPTDRVAFYPPLAISPVTYGPVYFGTHRVWASPDGGTTWSAASPDLTNGAYLSALAVSPVSGTLFAGSFDGRLSYSLDLSAWRTGAGLPDRSITSIAPDPANAAVAYLSVSSFGSGHVFKTTDGGVTWINISGSLPDSPANSVVVDPRGVLYVATDVGVFRTEDSGLTWTSFNLGLPNAYVTSLALDIRSETLTAATYGRGAFQVRLKAPQSAGPGMVARGAVNAFSFSTVLAPGTLVSLFGTRLTVDTSQATTAPYPLTLAGTSVTVNGIPAPIMFASPNQVNFQMPFNVTGSEALITVSTIEGTSSLLAALAPSAPGILSYGALHATTGARVDESNPAAAGEYLLLYGTGLGATAPQVKAGDAAPLDALVQTVAKVTCMIGGEPAKVAFAGLAPGFAGLYQINVEVPPGVAGKTELTISTDGRISNAIVLYVKSVFITNGPPGLW